MVKHVQIKCVAEVDKFFNKSGLRLNEAQIVYTVGKFGGNYMVFYEEPDEAPTEEQ